MARVTAADVLQIIKTKVDDASIPTFISAANILVTAKCGGYYPDAELKEIERWLAAHFISVADPRLRSESFGDNSVVYIATSMVGEGLASTPAGQQVLLLDYLGKLNKLRGQINVEAF